MREFKRILITGAAGFVGRHVVEYLLTETDWDLVCLDGLNYAGNFNRLTNLYRRIPMPPDRMKLVFHNLRAPINSLVQKSIGEVDAVIHLAANSSVEYTLKHPRVSVLDNVLATVNVLEYARETDTLVEYFSTDEVYGPVEKPGDGFSEDAPHNPSNPYSAGKAAGEDYCRAYHVSYGLPVIISNSMNIFGYAQHPEKFIPMVIKQVYSGGTVPIYASPDKKTAGSRYWIFGYDVADALLYILGQGKEGEKYHIVGEWWDNLSLAQKIAQIMKKPLRYQMFDFHSSRPGHDMHYGLKDNKLHKLGWNPRTGVTEGLKLIIPTYIPDEP